jgi:riboflavin transporter FmnP
MTAVFSGICLIIATVIFGVFGSLGLAAGRSVAEFTGAKVGFGIGLALGMVVIAWGLRRYADRLRARSTNLYRGAWIGSIAALVIITVMAYFPQVAFPQYCPPGQVCSNGQRA